MRIVTLMFAVVPLALVGCIGGSESESSGDTVERVEESAARATGTGPVPHGRLGLEPCRVADRRIPCTPQPPTPHRRVQ